MKWNKYTIKTKQEACDYICEILYGFGIKGVEIEDNLGLTKQEIAEQFIDYVPTLPDSDDASVIFYTEVDEDDEIKDSYNLTGVELVDNTLKISDEELLERIREEILNAKSFLNIGEGSIKKEISVDTDWKDNWKDFFKPFNVGNFRILPIWDKDEEACINAPNNKNDIYNPEHKEEIKLYIDPGMSFGTGKHETTALCLLELEKYVKKGARVFDVGCGSAILSVAARKLGANKIFLTDIDPEAIRVIPHSFKINGINIDDSIEYTKGDVISEEGIFNKAKNEKYDIVVANILADVIIPLAGVVHEFMKKDGVFISSGIIYTREQEVVEAINKNDNLVLKDVKRDGDWVMVSATLK